MLTQNKFKIHRAWLVLLGCCFMQGGSLGVIMNTVGLFFNAVSADLGFSVGSISLYKTISGVSSCILLPFVGKVLYKFDTRKTIGACAVVMAACAALMGTFNSLPQWYIAAFIQGIASAMLLVAGAPIILANWFSEKLGLAIGISAAFSGLMGIICNIGFEKIISAYGWRMGYYVSAAVCFLMIFPMALFVIRLKPEMVGCTPYGTKKEEAKVNPGVLLSPVQRFTVITLLVICVCSMQFCTGFSTHIVNYAVSVGGTLAMGAVLVSWSMITNAAGKIALGSINDVAGLKGSCLCGFIFTIPGFLLFLFGNQAAMSAGSAFYGVAMSLALITPPLLTRKFFSDAEYPKVFSFIMMLSTLGSSFSSAVFGWMYDASGNFVSVIVLCLVLCVIYLAMCILLYIIIKKARKIYT